MRWNALRSGNLYVKRHQELQGKTVKELQEMLRVEPSLVRQIMFYGIKLRGKILFYQYKCYIISSCIYGHTIALITHPVFPMHIYRYYTHYTTTIRYILYNNNYINCNKQNLKLLLNTLHSRCIFPI